MLCFYIACDLLLRQRYADGTDGRFAWYVYWMLYVSLARGIQDSEFAKNACVRIKRSSLVTSVPSLNTDILIPDAGFRMIQFQNYAIKQAGGTFHEAV
jgi:hypothetical protein